MTVKKDIVWRVALIYVCMLLFGLAIIARIIYLQFVEAGSLTQKAMQLSVKDIEIIPNRGNILASDGRLLATSIPYYEIRVDVSKYNISRDLFIDNIDSLALRLSQIFKDKSERAYKNELTSARVTSNRYYLLKRKADFEELKQVRTCPIFRLGRHKGGLIVLQNGVRFLPYGDLAARTIGYLSKSDAGTVVGIEGSFETELRGEKGIMLMQRVPGNIWMPINGENEVEPKDGCDVLTTLDLNIQDVAQVALRKQLELHNAHHGTAVLMEVSTGEVKAIANLERDKDGVYRELYNYSIAESTEPGSTFKLPVIMAALEDGYVSLDDTIETGKGTLQVYDKVIHDSNEEGHGNITVQQVFELSSNIGVAKIVMDHYGKHEEQFIKRLYSFGLNKKNGLQIKGEGAPDIKYPGTKYWSGISLAMMSHGYEVRLTPLQILTFYNAVANNGRMVKPMFVKELRFRGRSIKKFDPEVLVPSICSMSTIRKARKMMEGVVQHGTAMNLRDSMLSIAGKTGTAQIANKNKGYRQDAKLSYQASFVGYFPAENPKYSCIVVINAPSNDVYYGNLVAGPVFREIAQKVYATSFTLHGDVMKGKSSLKSDAPYSKNGSTPGLTECLDELGVPYDFKSDDETPWIAASRGESRIELRNKKVSKNLVPDVVGMGAKDAIFLIESTGMRTVVSGYGTVVRQSVGPGNRPVPGGTVYLTMSQGQ